MVCLQRYGQDMQHEKAVAAGSPGPGIATLVRVLLDPLPVGALLPPVRKVIAGERDRVRSMRISDGGGNRWRLRTLPAETTIVQRSGGAP